MNKLTELFKSKKEKLLSVYLTAGYPELESTLPLIKSAEEYGVDFIEVGFPFSDPLADGPVIQKTSEMAIKNGMNLDFLLDTLKSAANTINIPLILMGYLNPVLKMGIEKFCSRCAEANISGVIIPDLPPEEFANKYKDLFKKSNLHMIFLVTPRTSEKRIKFLDATGSGFIYAVSTSSTTGKESDFARIDLDYLSKLGGMNLRNPIITGFGIHNSNTLNSVWSHSSGAIIGSAYLKAVSESENAEDGIKLLFKRLGLNNL